MQRRNAQDVLDSYQMYHCKSRKKEGHEKKICGLKLERGGTKIPAAKIEKPYFA